MIYRLVIQLILATVATIVILGSLPTNILFTSFPFEPKSYEVPKSMKIDWNTFLSDNSQLLFENQITGPESIAISGGYLYTGLADGRLIEVNKKTLDLRDVTQFEQTSDKHQCYDNNYWNIENCGRPLGLRFDTAGTLYVLDAISGLYRVNVKNGEKTQIALSSRDKNLPKEWSGLFNDFVFDPIDSNIVYITVSTRTWPMRQIFWSIFEHENSGCILALNLKTGKIVKISDGFYLLNSVEISADKKYLLASETSLHRILKYSLDEIHSQITAGKIELTILAQIFIDNLPGEIDNIRLHNGNIYGALGLTRINGSQSLGDRLAEYTLVKKGIGRLIYLTSIAIKYFRNHVYSTPLFEELEYQLNSGSIFYSSVSPSGSIVILDGRTGQLKRLLGSNKFSFLSEVVIDEENGDLYFGSFRNRFIGKVKGKLLS